ncbi:MAG TPA: hypothetical protein V6D22_23650 [Candidatus Obscuribacterales bacterium]
METFIVLFGVALVIYAVYAYIKRDTLRKQDLYAFISENLVFLGVAINDVERLQEKYFHGLPGAAEQLAAARQSYDLIASNVRGQLGLRTVAQLEEYKQLLLATSNDVNGLRRFVVNRLTDEQRAEEGLES